MRRWRETAVYLVGVAVDCLGLVAGLVFCTGCGCLRVDGRHGRLRIPDGGGEIQVSRDSILVGSRLTVHSWGLSVLPKTTFPAGLRSNRNLRRLCDYRGGSIFWAGCDFQSADAAAHAAAHGRRKNHYATEIILPAIRDCKPRPSTSRGALRLRSRHGQLRGGATEIQMARELLEQGISDAGKGGETQGRRSAGLRENEN
jgi:hypothetical protein